MTTSPDTTNSIATAAKAVSTLGSLASLSGVGGAVPVAHVITSAPGILGWLGATTTTTIVVPLVGVAAVGGALVCGGVMAYDYLKK